MSIQNKIDTAIKYHVEGNLKQAENIYKEVLVQLSDNFEILHKLAILYTQSNNLYNAVIYFNKALDLNPESSIKKEILEVLAEIYKISNEPKAELKAYIQILEISPYDISANVNVGYTFLEINDIENAIKHFNNAVYADSECIDAYTGLAQTLVAKGDLDTAIKCYLKLLELDPNNYEYHYNLGQSYINKNDINNAYKAFITSIQLNQNFEDAYLSVADIYFKTSNFDKALEFINSALKINPENPVSHNLLGVIYRTPENMEKSIFHLEKALKALPNSPQIKYNLAGAYLITKNFDKGWDFFESRLECLSEHKLKFPFNLKPKWDGRDNIKGKTVYVYNATPYYAYGDSIMFARYLPEITARGAKVIFKPQPLLYSLFKNNNLNAEIIEDSTPDTSINFDYQLPIMSIVHPFKSTNIDIPLKDKYIEAQKEKADNYKQEFFNHSKFKIGIVWYCSNLLDNRSTTVDKFQVLSEFKNVELYSLQKGGDLSPVSDKLNIINIAKSLNDFSDTAAAIKNMDLVITVDTAVAHLAGAMGKSVWILLCHSPNWRWFLDCGDKSPWYNSAKIFRQTSAGHWDSVFYEVLKELKSLLNVL